MAIHTVTDLLDDLDGSAAAETVRFALDGRRYEIDLSADNARRVREALDIYVRAGRRTTASGRPYRRVEVPADPKVIRAWAASAGVDCPARGRLPRRVVEAFERAQAERPQAQAS